MQVSGTYRATAVMASALIIVLACQVIGLPRPAFAIDSLFFDSFDRQKNAIISRGPKIRGTIKTSDGKPVPAELQLILLTRVGRYPDLWSRLMGRGRATRHFYLRGPPAGSVISVLVDAPGYRPWQSADFIVGADLPPLHAILEPAEAVLVSGQVVDERGQPVSGAGIQLFKEGPLGGRYFQPLSPRIINAPIGQVYWARFVNLFGFDIPSAPHREDPGCSDAAGRFQIRQELRVGDRFSLEATSPGCTGFTLPVTLAATDALELPRLVLWRWAGVPNKDGYSFAPKPPPEAAQGDKESLGRQLTALSSINDPQAQPLLTGLHQSLVGADPGPAQVRAAARFLDSAKPAIAGAAAKLLATVDDLALLPKLARDYPLMDKDVDRLIVLARHLHEHGDDALLDHLAGRRDEDNDALRRKLAFGLLPVAPRHLAAVYLELLSNHAPWCVTMPWVGYGNFLVGVISGSTPTVAPKIRPRHLAAGTPGCCTPGTRCRSPVRPTSRTDGWGLSWATSLNHRVWLRKT